MKCRRLLITGVLLLGGAIVNVAVAWGTLQRNGGITGVRRGSSNAPFQRPLTESEERWTQANAVPSIMQLLPEAERGTPVAEEQRQLGWRRIVIKEEFLRIGSGEGRPTGTAWKSTGRTVASRMHLIESGWPTRSFCIEFGQPSETRTYADNRPIWHGFAINTIYYAAMLWVVWFTPGMVRRRIRRRRGLCPTCAYPIGTSPVCTECGKTIPGAVIQPRKRVGL